MLPSVEELTRIFSIYPWRPEALAQGFKPLISAEVARQRAEDLHGTLSMSGFAWDIKPGFPTRAVQLPTYEITGTHFGAETNSGASDVRTAHGVGLNWGNPLKLAKVCSIAQKHFGSDWMLQPRFKKKLLSGNDHLSFVEEFLWLGMWHDVTGVKPGEPPVYEAKPFAPLTPKEIDWRFSSCGQTINLEIKNRPRDWMRHVDGADFNVVMDGYYEDCEGKFPTRQDGELNLIGISSPCSIDRSWRLQTHTWLLNHPEVDGVIMWAKDTQNSSYTFDFQSKKRQLLEHLFTSTDEDIGHIAVVMHVWKARDSRRADRAEEISGIMERMSAKNYQAFLDSVCGGDRQKA